VYSPTPVRRGCNRPCRYHIVFLTICWLCVLNCFVAPAIAQSGITTICDERADLSQATIPPVFYGTYYYLMDGGDGTPYRFALVSQNGTVELQAPLSSEMAGIVTAPIISSDGRFMAFRPASSDAPLVVWDIETREIATLTLPQDDVEYLLGNFDPYDRLQDDYSRFRDALIWRDSTHLVIQFQSDYSGQNEAEREITVSENPLQLVHGARAAIEYPELPIPSGEREQVTLLSPQENYAASLTWTLVSGGTDLRHLQVYDLRTGAMVFDLPPTREFFAGNGAPLWLPDESRLFFLAGNEGEHSYSLTQVDLGGGYRLNNSLWNELENSFGTSISVSGGFLPKLSDDGSLLAFEITRASEGNNYLIIYHPESASITAICDPNQISRTDYVYTFWSPDNRYFGYWDIGQVLTFDVQTGEIYMLPSTGRSFVGWAETSTPPA
jgi:hypothetical protein